jgi:hypothetical protein
LAALPGYRHLRALSRRRTPDASLKRLERSRSCRRHRREVRSSSEVQAGHLAALDPSPDRAFPLLRLPRPTECYLKSLAPSLLRRSPLALDPLRVGLQGFHVPSSRNIFMYPGFLSWARGSSSEVAQAPSRCMEQWSPKAPVPETSRAPHAAPPMRFIPLQRFPAQGSGLK